jgi:hypothetical protein
MAAAFVAGVEESRCAVSPGVTFGCGVFLGVSVSCMFMDGAGTGSLSCRTSSIAGLVYPLLDAFCAAMCAGLGSSWSQLCVGDTVFASVVQYECQCDPAGYCCRSVEAPTMTRWSVGSPRASARLHWGRGYGFVPDARCP